MTERLNAVAQEDVRFFDAWVSQQRRTIEYVAGHGAELAAPNSLAARYILDSVRVKLLAATEVRVILAPGGRVVNSTDPDAVGTYAIDELHYVRGRDSTFTQPIYPHPRTGAPTLTIATPVRSGGRTIAVIAAHLDLADVERVLEARNGSYRIESLLVDPLYRFLSAERFSTRGGRRGNHSAGIDGAVSKVPGSGEYVNHDGVEVIGAWSWFPELGMGVVVESPRDQAYAPARRLLGATVAFGLLALLVLAIGAARIARRATRPILGVAAAAERVAEGDFGTLAPVESMDEVGRLARRFNTMTGRLRDLVQQHHAQVTAAALALREAEASRTLLQDLSDHTTALVAVVDLDLNVRLANRQLERLLRVPRGGLMGKPLLDVLPPAAVDRLRPAISHVISGGSAEEIELEIETPVESHLWQATIVLLRDTAGTPYAVGLLAADLTERARAEEERRQVDARVQQAQKLESLGIMAGGIAHDFNNILGAVLGNAELAHHAVDDPAEVRGALEQIGSAARRAADLTRQMLAYAGKASLRREVIDIRPVLEDMLQLVRAAQSKKVQFTADAMPDALWVEIDPSQLSQVVLNLLTNAAEAIGDRVGTVRLGAADHTERGGRRWVRLVVEDDGDGMTAEVQQRLFEPFYSTKGSGRGLGLSAVMGIIRSAGGELDLKSTPGIGTRFEILLPAAVTPAEASPARSDAPQPKKGGAVLVIDDEAALRRVSRRALEGQGHEIIEAADGVEGIARFNENRDRLVLVVLDLTMPGLGGAEVLARIRASRTDLPVVIASGYAQGDDSVGADDPNVRYLQKPFGVKLLVSLADELIRR